MIQFLPPSDGSHTSEPYLPLEPEIALTTGQYASDVDVLLGQLDSFSTLYFGVKVLWQMKL